MTILAVEPGACASFPPKIHPRLAWCVSFNGWLKSGQNWGYFPGMYDWILACATVALEVVRKV